MKLTDSAVDISLFSFPIAKEDIFCNKNPLVLEIGFGEGDVSDKRSVVRRKQKLPGS